MKNPVHKLLVGLSLLSILNPQLSTLFAQGTAFTYQGRLDENGVPYTGHAEFQPTLWDAASDGSPVAAHSPATVIVGVTNGLLVLPLDFGASFPGADRWLQLEVRTVIGPFTPLSPRQKLTPTPYAITAGNLSGTLPASQLGGTLPSANLGGTYSGVVTFNSAANSFTGSGAGLTGLDASQLTSGTVPDVRLAANVARTNQVWLLSGNAGATPGTHFLGTTDNQPLELKVNGLRALRLEDNGDSSDLGTTPDGAPNVIGGSPHNFVAAGVVGAAVAGGGATNYGGVSYTNSIRSGFGVIGGGLGNNIAANSLCATIAGGSKNDIGTNANNSAIGGGRDNNIADNSPYATIAGGDSNDIGTNSDYSAIGGGRDNNIADNAPYATIPGGRFNSATNYAFAAGYRAKANHGGSFVWADSSNFDFSSTVPNGFFARSVGGVKFVTGIDASGNPDAGVRLTSGSSAWTTLSDRDAKENLAAVDGRTVLERLVALPIQTWNWKAQAEAIRHMGPMAQDFFAAFAVGEDERHISTVDADGVALAAIQGLNEKVEAGSQRSEDRSQKSEASLRKLQAENAELKQSVAELKAMVERLAQTRNP